MAQSRRRCYCSVPCCSNNKQHFPYLSFHDFPVDPEIRCLWVRATKRDEGPAFKILRGSTYVCSQHFAPDDKVTSFSGRVRLNQGAVPSRFHWNDWGKGRRQRSRRLNGLDDSQEMPVPGNSTAETLSADAVATDHDYAWRPSLVVEMACKKGISDGTVCPQRVQAKSEQSEVEILSRGGKSVHMFCVKQECQELLEPQKPTHIKEEEPETKVTPILLSIKQETDDMVPVSKPMESEPHVPPSELYTDWEEEKPKLKDESGGVSNPEPQLFSHHSPAGSRPDGKKEDETEPAEPNSSGPVNWLAPVEDDEGPDEAPGKCRRRLAFEVARRSLSAMLDSDSNDKKGNEVLQQVPGTNIHSLRFKARAEHHLVKLKAVSPHQRNPKHFACEMCGKVFISRRDRERHNRMHSGEKPFSCPHCHRSFSDRANMCKHMLIHSGVKPYICPDCGKGFSEKGNLRRHRGMIHGSIPKAHCKDCPKSYVEKSGLDRHIRSGACPGR